MFRAYPFFKRNNDEFDKVRLATQHDNMRKIEESNRLGESLKNVTYTPGKSFGDMLRGLPPRLPGMGAVREVDGHPRFGFKTMLDQVKVPLPTAPAVVGGNVDWNMAKSTPTTQYLHSVLSAGRPMKPPPALGSFLNLAEPHQQSIHTTY